MYYTRVLYYRSVFMGSDKETGEVVALKRINTEQEANGFPITAIREVKILKALDHPNVIKLREIVTSKGEIDCSCRMAGWMTWLGWQFVVLGLCMRLLCVFWILEFLFVRIIWG